MCFTTKINDRAFFSTWVYFLSLLERVREAKATGRSDLFGRTRANTAPTPYYVEGLPVIRIGKSAL